MPLLKKHIRLGHAGIVDHSVDLSIPDFKKSIKKDWTKGIRKAYKCITANTSAIWQHAAHTPTNLLFLAAKQEPYKKAYLFVKNIDEFSGKSSREWTSRQRKRQKE